MTVKELTDCIAIGEPIKIFEYDTNEIIYHGLNLEAEILTQTDKKVVYISVTSELIIGVV